MPLAGLKIVVTRPRDQAEQLAQGIERAGGTVILFPLLEISPVFDPATLHQLLRAVLPAVRTPRGIEVTIDVDPYNML